MTPLSRADLAAHLVRLAEALRQEGLGVREASLRVARTGTVTAADWTALAASQDAQVRVPASLLLTLAAYLEAPPAASQGLPRGVLSSYLVGLAQVLRKEADLLQPVRGRSSGDMLLVVEGVRASLLEQAALCVMLATWLEPGA